MQSHLYSNPKQLIAHPQRKDSHVFRLPLILCWTASPCASHPSLFLAESYFSIHPVHPQNQALCRKFSRPAMVVTFASNAAANFFAKEWLSTWISSGSHFSDGRMCFQKDLMYSAVNHQFPECIIKRSKRLAYLKRDWSGPAEGEAHSPLSGKLAGILDRLAHRIHSPGTWRRLGR